MIRIVSFSFLPLYFANHFCSSAVICVPFFVITTPSVLGIIMGASCYCNSSCVLGKADRQVLMSFPNYWFLFFSSAVPQAVLRNGTADMGMALILQCLMKSRKEIYMKINTNTAEI